MSGKAKIEGLTNSWYGFAVFSAVFSILMRDFGIFSMGRAIVGLILSWIVTWFLGRALIKKSSLVRALLILLSALFAVLGGLSVGRTAWNFFQTWQLGLLFTATYSAVAAWMNAKSFRTLMDGSVKAYFN
jgi:hypothetical protein